MHTSNFFSRNYQFKIYLQLLENFLILFERSLVMSFSKTDFGILKQEPSAFFNIFHNSRIKWKQKSSKITAAKIKITFKAFISLSAARFKLPKNSDW